MEAFGLGVTEGENGNILRFVRWSANISGFPGLGLGKEELISHQGTKL